MLLNTTKLDYVDKGSAKIESNRLPWTAPEVRLLNELTSESDVWAYGVLFWELLTLGATPFHDGIRLMCSFDNHDWLDSIMIFRFLADPTTLAGHLRNVPRLPKPPRATLTGQRLIDSCHEVNPKDRPVRY